QDRTNPPRFYHHTFPSTSSGLRSAYSFVQRLVERYFQPPSARRATTLPLSIRAATRWAVRNTAPDEMPAKMPSLSMSSFTAANEERESTTMRPSSSDSSRTGGMNPSSSERSPWTRSPGWGPGGGDFPAGV